MNITQLRVLAAVVEHASFTRAAEALGQSQPAVSKSVRMLEAELGAPLLFRKGEGVTPTSLGDEVLVHARATLRSFDTLRELARGRGKQQQGSLRIAVPPSLCAWPLPSILGALKRRHARIVPRIFEGDPDEIQTWVSSNVVDAALFTRPISGWCWTELCREDFIAVVARSTFNEGEVSMEELSQFQLVTSNCGINNVLSDAFRAAGHEIGDVIQTRSYNTIFAMVQEGLGISVLPASIAREAPATVAVLPIKNGPTRAVGMLTPESPGRMVEILLAQARAIVSADTGRWSS